MNAALEFIPSMLIRCRRLRRVGPVAAQMFVCHTESLISVDAERSHTCAPYKLRVGSFLKTKDCYFSVGDERNGM